MFLKQYELWQTCGNNCIFCFNKDGANKLNPDSQKKALLSVIQDLETVTKNHQESLSIELIGGDFFQGQLSTPEVYNLFFELMNKLYILGEEGKIQQVCLFVTLTLGDQKDLYKALSILKPNSTSKLDVWVSTSYDTAGRFITQDRLVNWENHMSKLAEMDINRNTTIIITQDFVDKVNSGQFDLQQFSNKYKTTLFFKQPVPPDYTSSTRKREDPYNDYKKLKEDFLKIYPWFFPKRKDTIKLLLHLKHLGLLDRLMGLNYRADELYSHFDRENKWDKFIRNKKENKESDFEDTRDCGHLLLYMCYSDSDGCILCDRDNILGCV